MRGSLKLLFLSDMGLGSSMLGPLSLGPWGLDFQSSRSVLMRLCHEIFCIIKAEHYHVIFIPKITLL